MNVGVFHSLAQAYRRELEAYTRYTAAAYSIDKVDFIMLYQKARETALTFKNIRSAWAKSGLYPLNPAIVLQKLPVVIKSRPKTSSEITLTGFNGASVSVAFTSTNFEQVNMLIQRVTDQEADSKVLKKLEKACKSAFANQCILEQSNEGLLTAVSRQNQRA